jgi:hypothetical protein
MTDQHAYETAEHEANVRAAERAHDQQNEARDKANEGAMRDAQAAIRVLLAVNGGAAIAVFAFIGNLASKTGF